MAQIRCPNPTCDTMLGIDTRGSVAIQHKGRTITVALPGLISIECEKCHTIIYPARELFAQMLAPTPLPPTGQGRADVAA